MASLSTFVLRHRRAVGVFWAAMVLAGAWVSGGVSDRLAKDFAVPGVASYTANQAILRDYGNGGGGPPDVPVITLPRGTTLKTPGVMPALSRGLAAVRRGHRLRVASYANTGDPRFVSADGRTTFALIFKPFRGELGVPLRLSPAITRALERELPRGTQVWVTGFDQLATGGDTRGPAVLSETLVGGLGALAVLAFVFGSLLAVVPLLLAGVSVLSTFLLIVVLTYVVDVSLIVEYLVALIGLGVSIDYSLLIVTRWREELAHGHTGHEAVQRSLVTAGRAVLISATIVAVGLVALVLLPVPAMRSIAYAGMLIPLVSASVAVTLLPALLATIGRRVDRPRHAASTTSPIWTAWTSWVVRHRGLAVLAATALLAALGLSALGLEVGQPRTASLAQTGPATAGLAALKRAGIPTGVLTPIEVLVPPRSVPATVAAHLRHVPGVHAAFAPRDPAWRQHGSLVSVLPAAELSSARGETTLTDVRTAAADLPGVRLGGAGALAIDETATFYGRFPFILALIAAMTFVLLVRAFRSLLLPAKAIALNLASVGATYGVLVLVWQHGHGSDVIWGIPATGAITNWVPLMTFAFLFGLSMDYEVFILSRIREEYDRTGSTNGAVIDGLARTGRLVTSAALILFFAFAALAASPGTDIKIMATGLGAGILLDATVVRGLLVPALVSLFGRWNWWLPSWAAHVVRVQPSPAQYESGTGRSRRRAGDPNPGTPPDMDGCGSDPDPFELPW
jgi:putative drug exporter of the RND superfamily